MHSELASISVAPRTFSIAYPIENQDISYDNKRGLAARRAIRLSMAVCCVTDRTLMIKALPINRAWNMHI